MAVASVAVDTLVAAGTLVVAEDFAGDSDMAWGSGLS